VEHFGVSLEYGFGHLDCIGIVLEANERSERMAIPEIKRVQPILDQEIEILVPKFLIVEKRKQIGGVGIFINAATREDIGFLHTDAGAAQDKLRRVGEV